MKQDNNDLINSKLLTNYLNIIFQDFLVFKMVYSKLFKCRDMLYEQTTSIRAKFIKYSSLV